MGTPNATKNTLWKRNMLPFSFMWQERRGINREGMVASALRKGRLAEGVLRKSKDIDHVKIIQSGLNSLREQSQVFRGGIAAPVSAEGVEGCGGSRFQPGA